MKEDLLWKEVLKRIREEVNSLIYATWFEPTKLKKSGSNEYIILVPTEVHKRHLEEVYYDLIIDNLLKEIDEVEKISFALEETIEEDLNYIPKHGVI